MTKTTAFNSTSAGSCFRRFTIGIVALTFRQALLFQPRIQPHRYFLGVGAFRPPTFFAIKNIFHSRSSINIINNNNTGSENDDTSSSRNSHSNSSSKRVGVDCNMSKRDSPSAQRNKEPIWQVLSTNVIPDLVAETPHQEDDLLRLRILEVAAGCGVHTEHFASNLLQQLDSTSASSRENLPVLSFQWFPTDPDETSRSSIQCYIDDSDRDVLGRVVQPPMPLTLDADGIQEESTSSTLLSSDQKIDLIICINMIHISPWDATLGLFKLAGQSLSKNGVLYCYGPYKEGGTAVESNLNFDTNLKSRNPLWGVRDLEQVVDVAKKEGLVLSEKIEMPANNLSLIFRRLS